MPKLNKKIKGLQSYDRDGNLAMFEEIQDLADNTGEIAKIFKGVKVSDITTIKGDKGDKGDSIKGNKGDNGDAIKGDKGDSPTNKELLKIIKPLIPDPIKGLDGKNASIEDVAREVLNKIPEVDKGEIADLVIKQIPASGGDIRNSLELLQEDDRLDKSAIKGIEELKKELREEISAVRSMKSSNAFGGLVNTVRFVDLTAQCDGSNKTFQVPLHRKVVMLSGTQFPLIYRPVVDYTTANHSLKLTSEVGAPETGQTLIFQYIK